MITIHRAHLSPLLLLLFGCSPEVGDRSAAIENGGAPTNVAAHSAVIIEGKTDGRSFCSGVLLPDGQRVVTAAHCLDVHLISESMMRLRGVPYAAPQLKVHGVAVVGGDTVVAGTVNETSGKRAVFLRYPASGGPAVAYPASASDGNSGLNAIVLTPDGFVGAGWVGPVDQRRVALYREAAPGAVLAAAESSLSTVDGQVRKTELGLGIATALLRAPGINGHLFVAGYTQVAGVDRPFLREYDGSDQLVATLLDPQAVISAPFANFRIADIALHDDGRIAAVGTRAGSSGGAPSEAWLVTFAAGGGLAPAIVTLVSDPLHSAVGLALDITSTGSPVALVTVGDESRVYKIDANGTQTRSLSAASHYWFNSNVPAMPRQPATTTTSAVPAYERWTYEGLNAKDLVLDASDRVIVVGDVASRQGTTTLSHSVVLRLSSDLSLDSTFGANGVMLEQSVHDADEPTSAELDTGADAVVLSGSIIHVAGHGAQAGDLAGNHRVVLALRYASTLAGSAHGTPTVNGQDVSGVAIHPSLDLAVATLASALETEPGYTSLVFAAPIAAMQVSCIGAAQTSNLLEGNFTLSRVLSLAQDPATTTGAVLATSAIQRGDSGGGCFTASGELVGVISRRLSDRNHGTVIIGGTEAISFVRP